MNNQWSLETYGNPLEKVHNLIRQIWLETNLDGMLVTMNGSGEASAMPRYIVDVESINEINPFKPLMEINIARLVPDLLASHPDARIGALLRPCEMRALTEMTKHASFKIDNLLTFSVDCLGTLPADEYQWRLERIEKTHISEKKSPADSYGELANEALQFARQGGIIPYRYRSACQVCLSPAAEHANINLHILGLPVRQQMLLSVSDSKIAETIHLEKLTNGLADEALINQYERILSKMCERHQRTMERVNEGLGDLLPAEVDAVIHQLDSCGACQNCMDVCPICSVDRPYRNTDGHYDRSAVMRWLVSCAGCGMCEQSCPTHLPISAIFAHIRQKLAQEWEYTPGRSLNDPLPLIQ
jgi:formate dehydrogenase subunit beta